MKLLLTSEGLSNASIKTAFLEMLSKPPSECTAVFITTAANAEGGGKEWQINNMKQLADCGFKMVDLLDPMGVPKDVWEPRLEAADVIMVGGGNTFYLMHSLHELGIAARIEELLKDRVYVGISAGSMVASANLSLSDANRIFSQELAEYKSDTSLALVDFQIIPHYLSPSFENTSDAFLEVETTHTTNVVYALDDHSAIKVVNGEIEIVSEGKSRVFNQK